MFKLLRVRAGIAAAIWSIGSEAAPKQTGKLRADPCAGDVYQQDCQCTMQWSIEYMLRVGARTRSHEQAPASLEASRCTTDYDETPSLVSIYPRMLVHLRWRQAGSAVLWKGMGRMMVAMVS